MSHAVKIHRFDFVVNSHTRAYSRYIHVPDYEFNLTDSFFYPALRHIVRGVDPDKSSIVVMYKDMFCSLSHRVLMSVWDQVVFIDDHRRNVQDVVYGDVYEVRRKNLAVLCTPKVDSDNLIYVVVFNTYYPVLVWAFDSVCLSLYMKTVRSIKTPDTSEYCAYMCAAVASRVRNAPTIEQFENEARLAMRDCARIIGGVELRRCQWPQLAEHINFRT